MSERRVHLARSSTDTSSGIFAEFGDRGRRNFLPDVPLISQADIIPAVLISIALAQTVSIFRYNPKKNHPESDAAHNEKSKLPEIKNKLSRPQL